MRLLRPIWLRWKNSWPLSKRTSNQAGEPQESASSLQEVQAHLRKLASHLLHLEITTIIQPDIIGTKMPNPRSALLDIATTYRQELARQGILLLPNQSVLGGYEAFEQIRQRAQTGIAALANQTPALTPETQSDLTRLYEIQDKADHILGIFHALQQRGSATWDNDYTRVQIESTQPAFPLTPDEFLLIRKLWELGLEEIAMQTVIQIDGDVITRVHPKYAAVSYQSLHTIHQDGIRMSVAFWTELIGIVEAFVTTVGARFL